MVKKLCIIIPIILSLACARSANRVSQSVQSNNAPRVSNVLWGHHGGSSAANNIVNNQLPSSGGISVAAKEVGYIIYSSPLVLKHSQSEQHVYALWAKSDSLKIVKYTHSGSNLDKDLDFGEDGQIALTPSKETNSHQAHQMAIHVPSTGAAVLYVAHGTGITGYNAMTGQELYSYDTTSDPVYRLAIHNNEHLIAQTANNMLKLPLSLSKDQLVKFNIDGGVHATHQLPLVISGDAVFFESNNAVYKTRIDSFNGFEADNANKNHRFQTNADDLIINTASDAIKNKKVTAMSAITIDGKDSIVYAITRNFKIQLVDKAGLANPANDTSFFIFGISPTNGFDFNRHAGTRQTPGPYSQYCQSFDTHFIEAFYFKERFVSDNDLYTFKNYFTDDFKYTTSSSNSYMYQSSCTIGAGDSSITPLAVHKHELFLPGTYWNKYCTNGDCQNSLVGIQKIGHSNSPQNVFEQSHHKVKESTATEYNSAVLDRATKQHKLALNFYYTNRWVVHDPDRGITFTVANISDYFYNTDLRLNNDAPANKAFATFLSDHDLAKNVCNSEVKPTNFGEETYYICQGSDSRESFKKIIPHDLNSLTSAHSKIVVGNQSSVTEDSFDNQTMLITAISVGDGVVFLAGDDSHLYWFK